MTIDSKESKENLSKSSDPIFGFQPEAAINSFSVPSVQRNIDYFISIPLLPMKLINMLPRNTSMCVKK
jgi:hypothetical protein